MPCQVCAGNSLLIAALEVQDVQPYADICMYLHTPPRSICRARSVGPAECYHDVDVVNIDGAGESWQLPAMRSAQGPKNTYPTRQTRLSHPSGKAQMRYSDPPQNKETEKRHPIVVMTSRTHVGIHFVYRSRHEGRCSEATNAHYLNSSVAAREKRQQESNCGRPAGRRHRFMFQRVLLFDVWAEAHKRSCTQRLAMETPRPRHKRLPPITINASRGGGGTSRQRPGDPRPIEKQKVRKARRGCSSVWGRSPKVPEVAFDLSSLCFPRSPSPSGSSTQALHSNHSGSSRGRFPGKSGRIWS